jgi:hypothetical protein
MPANPALMLRLETGEQIQLHDLFPSKAAATGAAKAGRE